MDVCSAFIQLNGSMASVKRPEEIQNVIIFNLAWNMINEEVDK
jgi:hypothetical protein